MFRIVVQKLSCDIMNKRHSSLELKFLYKDIYFGDNMVYAKAG